VHSEVTIPEWAAEVLCCPADGGALTIASEGAACERCDRAYGVTDGILQLLPDRLAHLATAGAAPEEAHENQEQDVAWIEDEMRWWDPWWERMPTDPLSRHAGLRGRSRERHLLRHVRHRLPPDPLVVEMGAGSSRTVAGLWPPAEHGLRYVATDMSLPALRAGRGIVGPGCAFVQCDAVEWPIREASADLVMILGVLHHLSDWRAALARACRTVRPGGLMVLHEAVTKPRLLASRRPHGVDDGWVSPHEGDVPASELRAELTRHGDILSWRGEESPLRFALNRYLIERRRRSDLLERSRALTATFDLLDQVFGRTAGRVAPSLSFNEVNAVWQRPGR